MKKLICFVLCTLLLTAMFVPAVSAEYEEERVYFDDGSYIEFSDKIIPIPPSGFEDAVGPEGDEDYGESVESAGSAHSLISRIIKWLKSIIKKIKNNKTVTKTKYANYYSSEGEPLWSVYLTAEFTYNGRKAVCTSSSVHHTTIDHDWKLIYSSHSEDGNTAVGNFVMKQYKLGVPLKEIEKTLTLVCDKNGNVK